MATHREGWYRGAGGLSLYYQSWHPDAAPRGTLLNIHGLGDHSGLHPSVATHFSAAGWAVYGCDLRGHGRSPGQRAYVRRWSDYRDDVRGLADLAAEREAGPCFMLGHSLGGLIALDFALHYPQAIRGVIAAAPPLGAVGVPPLLLWLGRVLSGVWPRFSLNVGMDLSNLSRDPGVVDAILADPLFHRKGTARLATEVLAAIARVQAAAPALAVPALLLHGTGDRMVSPEGTRAFAARAPRAELREYDGAYHVLFADWVQHEVLCDVERWMEGLR